MKRQKRSWIKLVKWRWEINPALMWGVIAKTKKNATFFT